MNKPTLKKSNNSQHQHNDTVYFSSMGMIDVFLVVPLLWGAYKGFKKGLIVEVFSLVALVLGIIAAVYFPQFAQKSITTTFQLETGIIPILAFITTFLTVVVIVSLLGKMIEKMIDVLSLSFFNKLGGLAFGIIKTALILSVLLFLFEGVNRKFEFIGDDKKQNSLLYKPLVGFSSMMLPILTDGEWLDDFIKQKERVEKRLDAYLINQ